MSPVSLKEIGTLSLELPLADSVENRRAFSLITSMLPRGIGNQTSFSDAHSTVLFLGNPLRLWSELFPDQDDPTRFLRHLGVCVQSILDSPAPGHVSATGISVFEHAGNRALVVVLRKDPSLLALRRSAWQRIVKMLEKLGLANAEQRLVNSHTLAMPDVIWNPHVTVVKRVPEGAPSFTVNLVDPIRLSVGNPRLHGWAGGSHVSFQNGNVAGSAGSIR